MTTKTKTSPLAEVTVRLTGRSLTKVLERLKDPSAPKVAELERKIETIQAESKARFDTGNILAEQVRAGQLDLAKAAAACDDLQRRIKNGLLALDRAPDPRPAWMTLAVAYLKDVMRPVIWTHACPNARDQSVPLTDLETCACGARKG